MNEKRGFSGSGDFAKSLEPGYKPKPSIDRAHTTVVPEKKPSFSPKSLFTQPTSVMKSAPKEKVVHPHHPHRRKAFEVLAAFYLLLVLALIAFLAVKTDTTPFAVLLGLLPTIFTVVFAMIVYESGKDNKNVLWFIPILLVGGFYYLGISGIAIFGNVDVGALTAINLVLSFLYLIINYFLLQAKSGALPTKNKIIVKEKVVEKVVEKEVIPDDLSKFIASIEDKSKALNFVIGRVYNAYHGGTKDLRLKINMKQEWYDQFSQLPEDPLKINFLELSALISTIESRLRLLEKSEIEIFGLDHKQFKHLVRDASGKDKVIDVLDKNDKDPVKGYVEGALQFCGKVKDFIKKREAPEVKNEYVARPDEDKKSAPRSSSWNSDSKLVK